MSNRLLSHRIYGQVGRPALLFLHGFLGSKEDWHETALALSRDHYIVAVDLPGHGSSVDGLPLADYQMAGCALAIGFLLDHLLIETGTIVGYSMGGRMALYFAVHHANRCHRIILESASPGLRTETDRTARRTRDEAIAEKLLTCPLEQFLDDWYAQPLFEPLRQNTRFTELYQRRLRNNRKSLALSLRHMGTGAQPSLWDKLGHIKLPVLLLAGAHDAKFVQIAKEMAQQLPNSKIEVIAGAGHTLHFEASDRYISIIQDFLLERK